MIGNSEALQQVLRLVARIAPSDENVLIQGESGTGKEMIAREVHRLSHRGGGPFVAVNCAALQETLLESEIFGHERGAFTSADRARVGLIESASGGTFFIDEIGEMSYPLQAKLLRVVEDRRVRRVGGTRFSETDVRIVTATNRDLAEAVRCGRFREDLFYRLNVLSVRMPPLRERREDIPALVAYFLSLDPQRPQSIALPALRFLQEYDWPGNIRHLHNVVKRAQILCEETRITVQDLPEELTSPRRRNPLPQKAEENATLDALERRHLQEALTHQHGNRTRAAEQLGISRHRLYRLLIKHGLAGK